LRDAAIYRHLYAIVVLCNISTGHGAQRRKKATPGQSFASYVTPVLAALIFITQMFKKNARAAGQTRRERLMFFG
jgi:hypothetical protein